MLRSTRGWPLATLALCLAGCPNGEPKTGATSSPTPTKTAVPTTSEGILEQVVRERCLVAEDPWALAHGILVYGEGVTLPDGSVAVERLVGDNLGGGLRFPSSRNNWPVEPHPGMFVKTLLEVGVKPDRAFRLRGGRSVTLAQLAEAYREHYQGPEAGDRPFHNQAWLLEVAAATRDERVEALQEHALQHLEEQQAYLDPWVKDPAKRYTKPAVKGKDGRPRPAHIHRYFCGGLHFVQGVQRLFGSPMPDRLRKQFAVLLVRLQVETAYWDRTLVKVQAKYAVGTRPRELHTRNILAQKLKLQGHVLEAWHRAAKAKALTPTPAETAALKVGFDALAATVKALQREGIYGSLELLKNGPPGEQQLYRDLVGDSAHALHAYKLR